MLSILKVLAVTILMLGVLVYGGLIVGIYHYGMWPQIKTGWEKAPYLCFGLPCSAIASFGIVSMLELASDSKETEKLAFKAFGLDFSGPAGPVTLWILCFVAFVWAIKTLAK
ncbi:hypothetical protein [Methylomonas sp. MK1]|uniref:hypothetical protein n=1 Tax=Methylomonas sp. MK1 TaxID=1131552 RepID=UPI00037C50C3|nr:hypothetical protein [Methylomonas sp. MK1]